MSLLGQEPPTENIKGQEIMINMCNSCLNPESRCTCNRDNITPKYHTLKDVAFGINPKVYDPVHKPEHYNKTNPHGIECIQAIEAALTPEEFRGYLKGNCIKYIWRGNYKGHLVEDTKKAKWYLEKLLEILTPTGLTKGK